MKHILKACQIVIIGICIIVIMVFGFVGIFIWHFKLEPAIDFWSYSVSVLKDNFNKEKPLGSDWNSSDWNWYLEHDQSDKPMMSFFDYIKQDPNFFKDANGNLDASKCEKMLDRLTFINDELANKFRDVIMPLLTKYYADEKRK